MIIKIYNAASHLQLETYAYILYFNAYFDGRLTMMTDMSPEQVLVYLMWKYLELVCYRSDKAHGVK